MFCRLELVDLKATATNPQERNREKKKKKKEKEIRVETKWIYQNISQCF